MIPGGEPRAQLRVGAAMLGSIAAAIVFVVAILPRIDLGSGVRAEVQFELGGALESGAPVIVAGRVVGKVESITLADADAVPPGHDLADTGGSIVHVRIDDDRRWMVPFDGDYFISSRGLLSGRYLEVGPPRSGQPPGRPIRANDQIRGVDPPSIDRALQRTWDNLVRSREFLEAVSPELEALRAQLRELSVTLAEIEPTPGAYARLAIEMIDLLGEAGELRRTLADAGASPAELAALGDRAGAVLDHARGAIARVRAAAELLVADLDRVAAQAGKTAPDAIARLRAALAEGDVILARADALLASTRALLAMIERGEGSMMKLSRDPEFPEDAKALGKMLKRSPWRIIGHPDDTTGLPPRAPTRER
jgi:ABC-type transporter Mla subunit MlaD